MKSDNEAYTNRTFETLSTLSRNDICDILTSKGILNDDPRLDNFFQLPN